MVSTRFHGPGRILAAALLACVLAPAFLAGQAFTGSISGLITDASGAAIPEVTVTVTDLQRNIAVRATTNQEGFYLASPPRPAPTA